MIKILVHDIVNDVAIIKTIFGYSVRYGLEITKCDNLRAALDVFENSVAHALQREGEAT